MILALVLLSLIAAAEEAKQPYIDQQLMEMEAKNPPPTAPAVAGDTPYLEQLRTNAEKEEAKKPPEDRLTQGSYIEQLRRETPDDFKTPEPAGDSQSWLEKERAHLGQEKVESPIADLAAGKTRTQIKPEDLNTKNAFGLRLNAYATRGFTAEGSNHAFSDVYTSSWYPEFVLFYERQLVNSQTWGSIGLGVTAGFGLFEGQGLFSFDLNKPFPSGGTFGLTSRTHFTFVSVPVFFGASYRMNFLKYVRPYAQAMAGGLGAVEARNDGLPLRFGYGIAVAASAGLNFLLNWLDPQSSFELHDLVGVNRYYLTADFTLQIPVFGMIRYSNVALSAAMTYEF